MRRRPLWGAAGLLLFGAGLVAVALDVPAWNAVWYVPAWYGYLLLVDAAIFARRGSSFFSGRRRELLEMLFWSIPFWFFFEACNLVLANWYYVFGLRSPWASAGMAALAYATVLPACLFHAELLEAWGVFRQKTCTPLRIGSGLLRCVGVGGLSCVALPLLFPRAAFALIWFAPTGLEAVNFRRGSPSLLRDLEQGRCGRLLRLLAAGFWAGALWEMVNSVARCKWIYTVPGFEGSKLFEMPIAGFLGFPILTVGAFSFFSFVRSLLAGGWRRAAALLAVAFSVAAELGVERQTVRSRRPLLTELETLDSAAVLRLRGAGIPTPEWLSRVAAKEGVEVLSRRAGLPAPTLARAVAQADLAIHKGMGVQRAALLEAAGVGSVAELGGQEPEALSKRLAVLGSERGQDPPRPAEVRVWVRAAQASRGRPAR
jgi:hypothetical protein